MDQQDYDFKVRSLENQYKSKIKKIEKERDSLEVENKNLKANIAKSELLINQMNSSKAVPVKNTAQVKQVGYKPFSLKGFNLAVADYIKVIAEFSKEYSVALQREKEDVLEVNKGEAARIKIITQSKQQIFVRFFTSSEMNKLTGIQLWINETTHNSSNIIETLINLEKFLDK